jgi:hypothetical protein
MSDKQFLSRLKPLISTPTLWAAFVEKLDYEIASHQRKLEQSTDPHEMFRTQGAISALRRFYFLKEELTNV